MDQHTSPCSIDAYLKSLSESDRTALQPLTEMLELRYVFLDRDAGASESREVCFLSARDLAPARKHPSGRWEVRVVPLARVLGLALREEAAGVDVQLDLYESAPVVLRWSGMTLATVVEEKAFQLLMSTCGFASQMPERAGRAGFRSRI